jgi:hypothetical protein
LRAAIRVEDYLTLFAHIGVVAAKQDGSRFCFHVTGDAYRRNLLEPLLDSLKSSLVKLLLLSKKVEIYAQGESVMFHFVTSISN